jgi:AcrR family transcriptional regulator
MAKDTERQIVDATLSSLAAPSLRDRTQGGICKPAIYRHFSSKRQLLEAVGDEIWPQSNNHCMIVVEDDEMEAIERVVAHLLEIYTDEGIACFVFDVGELWQGGLHEVV